MIDSLQFILGAVVVGSLAAACWCFFQAGKRSSSQ